MRDAQPIGRALESGEGRAQVPLDVRGQRL
jgi:hypothetical protein